MVKRKLFYKLPPRYRFIARKIYYFPIDFYEKISGKRDSLIPPKGDIFIGSGDFKTQGQHQVNLLKKYGLLKATDNVLDVGSGLGRTALALSSYLTPEAKYEGFDVVKKGIDWCNKKLKPKFPNFNFTYVPLSNQLYNTHKDSPTLFEFPYKDKTFDKIFLFSVFTHMKIDEIENYLSEIQRVLKKDAICFATFFIYNQNDKLENFPGLKFPVIRDGYRLLDENLEEANIAIEKKHLLSIVKKYELEQVNFVKGFWSDFSIKNENIDFQDIIILRKL